MSFILIAASVVVAPVPKLASFGDWIVACDNVRHCEALALPPEDGSPSEWTLHVSRNAAAADSPRIEANPPGNDWDSMESPIRLVIDGRRTDREFNADGEVNGDAMNLLRAIAQAHTVTLTDHTGKQVGSIPVAGASAALRWLDDRQKRVGTVTAIIARGTGRESLVPASPKLPRTMQPPQSSAAPRALTKADVKTVLKGTNFCDEKPFEEMQAYRLDASHSVGIIPCMRHAYQSSYAIVIIDERGKWYPAPIEQPEPPGENSETSDTYLLTEADYDQNDRLLSMSYKGRGLADCGSSAAWAWDGKMFRLASYYALDKCRGTPPGEWLLRWQTANDPLTDE